MIACFPEPYPDELLFSLFARYYEKSGYLTYRSAAEDLYERPANRPDTDFINPLTEDARACLTRRCSMDKVILHHTMFPYYAAFLPAEKRTAFYGTLKHGNGPQIDLLKRFGNGRAKRYLRFCLDCAGEDRRRYGETYWHRMHQIPDVTVCPVHGCYLCNSDFLIGKGMTPCLTTAEELLYFPENIKYSENNMERHLAGYIQDIFLSDIWDDGKIPVGVFLDSCLDNTPYKSLRGEQRNITILANDVREYYEKISNNPFREMWKIQKIFSGDRFHPFEICLLADFLKIPPDQLQSRVLPVKSQQQRFDERIVKLHGQGYNYREISRQLNASYDLVKMIGEGRYGKGKAEMEKENRGGRTAKEWDKEDERLLPFVKETLAGLREKKGERPVRITLFKVEKQLGIPSKQLLRLKRCKQEVEQYTETQEEYWLRELLWAVQYLLENGKEVQWTKIRHMTNLKRSSIISCMPWIEKIENEEMKEILTRLGKG